MFTRQNNTVGKALRNTQEKGKACRIKKNAVLKKAMKDNKELRLMYGNLKRERDRLNADRDMVLIDLKNTEEERLELIKKNKKNGNSTMPKYLEEFIEKDQIRFRQHAFGIGDEVPFPQAADVEGAEHFVGFRKAGEKVIKGTGFEAAAEFVDEGGLGGAGRPQQEKVFPGSEGNPHQVDDLILADKRLLEGGEDGVLQGLGSSQNRGGHG